MASHGVDRITGGTFATRSEVIAANGMAATSQPLATQVALDILKAGGNAVDAAIAANAMLGLVEPTGCGIGGDLFAMIWDARGGKLHGLNGAGRSPRSLTRQWFLDNGHSKVPSRGPLPVSVPGCVDGWAMLNDRFGSRPLGELLAPTIRYARHGHPVTETIAHEWAGNLSLLSAFPGFTEQLTIRGQAPRKGEIWKNPGLADTLTAIADGGRDAFYQGQIADTIDAYLHANGGFLCAEDLAAHRGEWIVPVGSDYRGYEVWELPPSGQGIAALQILNILEGFDLAALGFGSPEHVHLFVEAKKLAYEDRARYYADPDFAEVPVERLISKQYAAERRRLIDRQLAAPAYPAGSSALDKGDTVCLSVADQAGNMISLIQSNYRSLGSGMTPPGLGFVLQNRGELFDLAEGRANSYAPGKRPFHTIIPAFITKNGNPWISFGVMGGAMQPQGHAQIVINLIDFGMNLQEAGDAPRIHHGGSSEPTGERMENGGEVNLESGFSDATVRALLARGHRVCRCAGVYGGYQAIMRDRRSGVYFGASESRKDGQAAGY